MDGQQYHKGVVGDFGRCLSCAGANDGQARVQHVRTRWGLLGRGDSVRRVATQSLALRGCSWGSTQYTRHNSRYICCGKLCRDNCFWRLASEAYDRRGIISPRRRYATLIKCLFSVRHTIPESSVGTPEPRGLRAATSIPPLAKSWTLLLRGVLTSVLVCQSSWVPLGFSWLSWTFLDLLGPWAQ